MELGDPGEMLSDRRDGGREPRRKAGSAAARDLTMYCVHCNAVWRREEVAKTEPRCLVCEGPLVDLEPE
jgi:hypothetical protein